MDSWFISSRLPTRPFLQSTGSLAASTTLTRGWVPAVYASIQPKHRSCRSDRSIWSVTLQSCRYRFWCHQACTVADSARDLGAVIDSCLTMADHVSAICRSGYFQLRQLRPVARSLTADAAKTIVHAFVACRLDYCNSLLHGITDSLFRWLQSIQNAAARLVTGILGDGMTSLRFWWTSIGYRFGAVSTIR